MESTTLASGEDAELILRLYELRREPVMRAARHWVVSQFWPEAATEVLAIYQDHGSQHDQYLRQVMSYWEMAASFVMRGALDGDMFFECNTECTYLLAKFHPFLAEIRRLRPEFLVRTEQLVAKHAIGRTHFEQVGKRLSRRPDSVYQAIATAAG